MTSTWINPMSATWLMMESPETPMHMGALAIFSKPRNAPKDFLRKLAEQMRSHTQTEPPWSYGLSNAPQWGLARHMSEVRKLDLDYHFRHVALPAPGGERDLGIVVSALHSQALDRSRPLWQILLIEGLADNRFAFYIKVHHALLTDVNVIPTVVRWLSQSPRSSNMPPPWAMATDPGELEANSLESTARDIMESLSSPGEVVSSLGKAAQGLWRAARGDRKDSNFLRPRTAPLSTLNRPISAQRRFATQQYEIARIERLAKATDSTINVVLTYLGGSALRRFFKEYNALPDEPLIGAIPISLRERSERTPGAAMTGIGVSLGTHIGDPLRRLEAIKESIAAVRADRQSLPEDAATSYALMRSAPIIASQLPGIGRFVPPLFNLGTSNTEGSDRPLYLNGARLEALYPMSQLLQYSALSIDSTNYAGTLNIGITGASDTLPSLQRLAVYMGNAVTDLEDLMGVKRKAA